MLSLVENLFFQKNPFQDLISSLNAVISTKESTRFITGPGLGTIQVEVVGWGGQKLAIFDDLQYCKLSEVGGPKKVKNMMT